MNKLLTYSFIVFIFHIILGYAMTYDFISLIFTHTAFAFAILHVIKTKNQNNEALLWAMYLVSFEVLMRMTDGLILHESIKYMVIILLGLGLLLEKNRPIPLIFLLYLLLMSVGIAFTQVPEGESIRKAITFNLSGPFSLGFTALYTFNRKINKELLLQLLWVGSLPIVSLLVYLYMRTPNLRDIGFTTEANFAASGGFGPNQVATILGFGIFLFTALILLKKRLSGFLFLDILILIYVTFRGFVTFSRGGIITAIIALVILSFFYLLQMKESLYHTLKFMVIAVVIGSGVWLYSSNITSGMLVNRYFNKTPTGEQNEDISSGRIDIFNKDLQLFYDNPFFGVGVGSGKYLRAEEDDKIAASHNEMSRLLSEHGLIGLMALGLLLIIPLFNVFNNSLFYKGFVLAFYLFWLLTINHSAMRVAFPGFIYGLSLLIITQQIEENNTIYRE